MRHFRKILFPVDFSEANIAMIPYVTEMAQRFDSTVTVLNAFNLIHEYNLAPSLDNCVSGPIAIPYTPDFQELRNERERLLEEFSRTHFASLKRTTRLDDGDPAKVIDWVAQQENTDLIVMPTKGRGRFRRMLLGSVTAKVLHDVGCSVFTSAHEPGPESGSRLGYRSIVCAVELNPEADAILKAAAFLAQAYGARICLLNIEPSLHGHDRETFAESVQSAFDKALKAGGQDIGVATTVRVQDGAVPEGIRRVAKEEAADLVVVGRGGEQGNLSRLWSQLCEIIRESPCPVLSV
jgi:nucleotide-binding universal stress UspA family protein